MKAMLINVHNSKAKKEKENRQKKKEKKKKEGNGGGCGEKQVEDFYFHYQSFVLYGSMMVVVVYKLLYS